MKKFLSLILLILSVSACDDGDFTAQDAFDFESETMNKCNSGETGFFLYKIKTNEALIFQIPETTFVNEVGTTTISLSSSNKVTYRNYNGTVATSDICTVVAPINPSPTNEWVATVGSVVIATTVNKTTNATTNATTITGYTHNITFKNIQFEIGNNTQQLFEEIVFGDFVTTATAFPDFTVTSLKKCGNELSLLFKNTSNKGLILHIPSGNFPTTVGTTTLLVNLENRVDYNLYDATLTDIALCGAIAPSPNETWSAEAGVASTSGMIEITTIDDVLGFLKHTIVLKKVKLVNGNVDFKLGDSYDFGFITTAP